MNKSIIAGLCAATLIPACATETAATCEKDYAGIKAAEIETIARGAEIYNEVEEADFTDEQRAAVQQTFDLLQSRERPVDEIDVAIIDRAKTILSSEDVWDREDDRICNDDDTTFSLFCALQFASKDITGEYQHRRTGLQEVRFALQDATEGREYEHRLRDFNNNPETTLADVYAVLDTARERVVERLALQEACAL